MRNKPVLQGTAALRSAASCPGQARGSWQRNFRFRSGLAVPRRPLGTAYESGGRPLGLAVPAHGRWDIFRWEFLAAAGMVLVLFSPALGASLFDEQDKDADAALKVQVEEDREITSEENRRFVQSNEDYLTSKVKTLEEKIRLMRAQIAALEADIKILKSKTEPVPQDQSQE